MSHFFRRSGVVAGAATVLLATQAQGAIGLIFTDNDATPTSTTVLAGSTFTFSVKLTETTVSDSTSGTDYQLHSNSNNVLEFLSRNSQVSGSLFTVGTAVNDGALSPVILNPNNGVDLGTSSTSGVGVPGPGTYELADYSFKVLSGTGPGAYTLSFVNVNGSGDGPSYSPITYSSLGTFAVTVAVPEPASVSLLAVAGAGLGLRRRRR